VRRRRVMNEEEIAEKIRYILEPVDNPFLYSIAKKIIVETQEEYRNLAMSMRNYSYNWSPRSILIKVKSFSGN
jgi:hypothetical protein